ncbi:putative cysteine-rich receptor-like protein kinase 9 [Arachis ipaensis]|uniref:putative cysteine-rich receptor-like protein kinase 9 n=1 Tax=Arachis ipaensis TaxID=130454 RepID=UPI000A2B4A3B|nr:putative cysteine-rich receptor-like protein kinase 9 [Arachis ipaensis]
MDMPHVTMLFCCVSDYATCRNAICPRVIHYIIITCAHHETSNITTEGSYGWLLATTLNDAIAEAAKSANGNKKFATKHVSLGGSQNVYTLVQCTPDLSSQDCSKCLNDVMKDIPICCLGTDGGMVLYPSCNLMFGLHRFYSDANLPINWYQLPKPFVGKPLSEYDSILASWL